MRKIRAIFRLAYLAIYTIWIVGSIMLVSYIKGYNPDYSMRRRRVWARHLLKAIGIELTIEGTPPTHPCLILSNHRAYLDPILILHDVLAYPVSKAEVENWPVLGYGAKVTGILYLKRESMTSRKNTLNAIADTIKKEGIPVILFPEGTTYGTPTTGDFKRGTFQLAASEGLSIVPVAMEYGSVADYWIGKETFVSHFLRRFQERRIYVRLRYGSSIQGSDAVELLQQTRSWIDAQLIDFKQEGAVRTSSLKLTPK